MSFTRTINSESLIYEHEINLQKKEYNISHNVAAQNQHLAPDHQQTQLMRPHKNKYNIKIK